jgi:transcription initiation factor IIF auxiliary subunit
MSTELEIQQWEDYKGNDWWKWAVWVEGSDELLDRIEYVEWTLHPTFHQPVRKVRNRSEKFRIETGGWGVFPIRALVQSKDGTALKLHHTLKLHYPDGKENER